MIMENFGGDEWQGTKAKVMEYTRKEPFNALHIAVGTGFLLGFLTRRSRG